MRRTLTCALLVALAGCGEEIPEEPTWIDDIRPILAANCARCHGVPAIGGAPPDFRLDRYSNTPAPGGQQIPGAAQLSALVAFRAGDEGDMPPDYPLPDEQREALVRWSEQAPSLDAPALGQRAGNRAPTLELVDGPSVGVAAVSLRYAIDDADGDLASGVLIAQPAAGGDEVVLSVDLRSGRDALAAPIDSLPAGSYDLIARLTDDLVSVDIDLGAITVP